MREDILQWRLAVVQWSLKFGSKTSGEVALQFAAVAEADGLDDKLWRNVHPSAVVGYLRQLEAAGKVRKAGTQDNSRRGEPSPLWCLVDAESVSAKFPVPPHLDDEPTGKPNVKRPKDSFFLGPPVLNLAGPAPAVKMLTELDKGQGEDEEEFDPARARAIESGFDRLAGMLHRHHREIAQLVQELRTALHPHRPD